MNAKPTSDIARSHIAAKRDNAIKKSHHPSACLQSCAALGMPHASFLRNHGKTARTPRRPFEKQRLDIEMKLIGEFGLKNKREVWRTQLTLARIRKAARVLLTLEDKDPKRLFEGNALLRRLVRLGVLDESKAQLDYVLALKPAVRAGRAREALPAGRRAGRGERCPIGRGRRGGRRWPSRRAERGGPPRVHLRQWGGGEGALPRQPTWHPGA